MKYALIIGNSKYDDPKLAQLKTPAADSRALAKVLDDGAIGSFDEVASLINESETRVRRAISAFLTNRKPEDLVLVYFSGHGVLDDRGRLNLALKDTQVNLLKATSIPASFVADEMDSCRSKRQILILDCCHSGAFARGTKGEQKAITETTFEGNGFGRVVLTASDSTQYALEGDQIIEQTELSLFTHFLLEGLQTGEADVNNDGHISLDEWYDYTYGKVISETPRQVPHKWSYNQQGDLIIAKNPHVKKRLVELPYELLQAMESPFVGIRESAVTELGKYLRARDAGMVDLAITALESMKQDDSRRISSLAERLLVEFGQARTPVAKPMPAVSTLDPAPATAGVSQLDPAFSQVAAAVEQASAAGPELSQAALQRPALHSRLPLRDIHLDRSSWWRWAGTAVLAIVLSILTLGYSRASDILEVLPGLFGIAAGLTSLLQWSFFRDRLGSWWIPANAVTGFGLGMLHVYLSNTTGWSTNDPQVFLVGWVMINFVLGIGLLAGKQEDAGLLFSLANNQGYHDIFLRLLSADLIIAGIYIVLSALELWDAANALGRLYGVTAILTALAFVLIKSIPRNFGLLALVLFLLLDGINELRFASNSDYPLYYFILGGIPALVSGIYFVFQKELWRNVGFIMAAGALILFGAAGISVDSYDVSKLLAMMGVLFSIPAGILLFLRK